MASEYYKRLKETEQDFCILLVEGGRNFAGNPEKCYLETIAKEEKIDADDPFLSHYVKELMRREEIQGYIKELRKAVDEDLESETLRAYLKQRLLAIIEECSVAEYKDRRGTKLSPAALRSVANHSIKTLMELTPGLKPKEDDGDEGDNKDHGVTFNVIVPDKPQKTKEQLELEASLNNDNK
jgi:hypothetical protein